MKNLDAKSVCESVAQMSKKVNFVGKEAVCMSAILFSLMVVISGVSPLALAVLALGPTMAGYVAVSEKLETKAKAHDEANGEVENTKDKK
ncbi:MAG: hypothetical protein GY909_15215 [Oligoflexia bacterium]|nr:hypothetical protein [Oligoflexia bacterium]